MRLKVLVWISSVLFVCLLSLFFEAVLNIKPGIILWLPIFAVVSSVARAICKKIDERQKNQNNNNL